MERFHLIEIYGFGTFLGERHVDVAVNEHYEPDFHGKIEESIEGWIRKTGSFS